MKVPTTHRHHRGVGLKFCEEPYEVIPAYEQLGPSRAAADLCGTTHKTVKRVMDKFEAGRLAGGYCGARVQLRQRG